MFFALSVSVFAVPAAATIVTSLLLLQRIGAVVSDVRVKPSRTSVTSVVPFFTLIEPSAQLPETTYVPLPLIVSAVPSILYPEYAPSDTVMPPSVNVKLVAFAVSYSAAAGIASCVRIRIAATRTASSFLFVRFIFIPPFCFAVGDLPFG